MPRTGAAARRRHPATVYNPKKDQRPDPAPTALERMTTARTLDGYRYWMDRLRERLAGDTLALDKIGLVYEGIDDANLQARRLRCSVKEIYRANERIAYHAELVKRDAPGREPGPGRGRCGPEGRRRSGGRRMTDPRKRTTAEVWQALDKFTADAELARLDAQSDEELDRALREAGIDPAEAAKVGLEALTKTPKEGPRPPRKVRWVAWVGAGAAVALIAIALGREQPNRRGRPARTDAERAGRAAARRRVPRVRPGALERVRRPAERRARAGSRGRDRSEGARGEAVAARRDPRGGGPLA